MKILNIRLYLVATILTMTVSSFLVSYILIDEIFDHAMSLGINTQTSEILSNYQSDLKKLKSLDENNLELYKSQFYKVQDAMIVFNDPKKFTQLIKRSYIIYFLIIFISILILSLLASYFLSRKVSNAYESLLSSDLEKSKRLQQLEYFDNWQHVAATLAHEIKNPLTPIEMMVTNLTEAYETNTENDFQANLRLTQKIVIEEVSRLKDMVTHFTEFSQLPESQLKPIDFVVFIHQSIKGFKTTWNNLEIDFKFPMALEIFQVNLDQALFKQCLINLIQNAIEANPQLELVKLEIKIIVTDNQLVEFYFSNKGTSLSNKKREKIFQVGFSSKASNQNNGLGLAIVKKIILEHHGNIETLPSQDGVIFRISLPTLTINNKS